MKCKKGYEIQVCKSANGYYKGTVSSYGEPNCRISSRYSSTESGAENLPLDRMNNIENHHCNGTGNCFL